MGAALALAATGCTESDDPDTPGDPPSTGAASNGAAAGGSGGTGAASGGAGSANGGSSSGGSGAAGGGAGGEAGLPWEDALDPNAGPSSDRLTARPLGSTAAQQGFYEYLPGGYPGGAKWPLLMVLHGIGENGNGTSELDDLFATGIPPLIQNDQWPGERPFVVLMPQHPDDDGCPPAAEVNAMFEYALANYEIDLRYVFLTGLSCGAIGSWTYLAEHLDEHIAAFVPVAGNGTGAFNSQGCDLAKVAIWAFHGDADNTVNVSGTNEPMDGLAACPKPPALETLKTIYPGVDHNSWDQTYNLMAGHDIYAWFLANPKP
jgi:hypothetical protein